MPRPGEQNTVQARILKYVESTGWTFVTQKEAEQRRSFDLEATGKDRGKSVSLFFDDMPDTKVCEFYTRYAEADGSLFSKFRRLHTDIYGKRKFVEHLRNRGKYSDHEESRERDLVLIDYDHPENKVFEVTEEPVFHNSYYGTREDVVFLKIGITTLVNERKNTAASDYCYIPLLIIINMMGMEAL